jgi:hypothetical protein
LVPSLSNSRAGLENLAGESGVLSLIKVRGGKTMDRRGPAREPERKKSGPFMEVEDFETKDISKEIRDRTYHYCKEILHFSDKDAQLWARFSEKAWRS